MRLTLERVAQFIVAKGEFEPQACATGYSIDSRTVHRGDLFFAVKGERLDGHDYVEAGLAAGAVGAVIAEREAGRFSNKRNLLMVAEPLHALQQLAIATRKSWGKPLVAVTGSAGKTTTKEAIAQVLSARYHVLRSAGNLNNHFGLPLQLLRLEPEHDIAVVELGMNHAGEIAALAAMAQPTVGVVTCVAPVHLEFFDSIAGIARAKYELIEALPADSTAVLNADDEYVSQFGRDFHGKVITYGIAKAADVRAENIVETGEGGSEFDIVCDSVRVAARLPLIGRQRQPSSAAAELAKLVAAEKRGEMLEVGGGKIINDCYNSNPVALRAVVEAMAAMPAKRRIVVAGEMLELGSSAPRFHEQAGEHIAAHADLLIGVRGAAEDMVRAAQAKGMDARFVETPEAAGELLASEVRAGDLVLLKASRGVRLERALEVLKKSKA